MSNFSKAAMLLILLAAIIGFSFGIVATENRNAIQGKSCHEAGGMWHNTWGGYCKKG